MTMKGFKQLFVHTEKISTIFGVAILIFGLYILNLLIRDFSLAGDIFTNLGMYGISLVPVFFGCGLLGLGLKWNRYLVMVSFAFCGLGIFFFIIFSILSLIAFTG